MIYKVFYVTENGARIVDRVYANSQANAIKQILNTYDDIVEIVQVTY